jgi:hypothetical protein
LTLYAKLERLLTIWRETGGIVMAGAMEPTDFEVPFRVDIVWILGTYALGALIVSGLLLLLSLIL